MASELAPTAFENIPRTLEPRTTEQVADLVKVQISGKDAEAFLALAAGFSADAVRFLAARVLLRQTLARVA